MVEVPASSRVLRSARYRVLFLAFPVSESDFLGFPFLPFRPDFFARFPRNGGALLSKLRVIVWGVFLLRLRSAQGPRWGGQYASYGIVGVRQT